MKAIHVLLLAILLSPSHLCAQTLLGKVTDQNREPVGGAEVLLLLASGAEQLRIVSDSAGLFRLSIAEPGAYRLRVAHLAFQTADSELIRIGDRETVTIEVELRTTALAMAPIMVTARSSDPRHTAFHERRLSRGQGRFITREEIDRTPYARTTELLRKVSGVTIVPSHEAGRSSHRGNLISIRGGARNCQPALYVDGTRVIQHVHSSMDDVLQAAMIEGIEVYTVGAAAPAGFGGEANTCGVIMFWTRVGRDPEARRVPWTQVALGAGLLGALLMFAQ